MTPVTLLHAKNMGMNEFYIVCCRMYAFDVHCNSYFPLFILLYGELLHLTSHLLLEVHMLSNFFVFFALCFTLWFLLQ